MLFGGILNGQCDEVLHHVVIRELALSVGNLRAEQFVGTEVRVRHQAVLAALVHRLVVGRAPASKVLDRVGG